MLLPTIRNFLRDDRGSVGIEFAFVASILVLGSVAGLLALRSELIESASEQSPTQETTTLSVDAR